MALSREDQVIVAGFGMIPFVKPGASGAMGQGWAMGGVRGSGASGGWLSVRRL